MGASQAARTACLALVANMLSVLVLGCVGPRLQPHTPSRQELAIECVFVNLQLQELYGPTEPYAVNQIGVGQAYSVGHKLKEQGRRHVFFGPQVGASQPPEPPDNESENTSPGGAGLRAGVGVLMGRENDKTFSVEAEWVTETSVHYQAKGNLAIKQGESLVLLLPDKEKPVFAVVCWIRSKISEKP